MTNVSKKKPGKKVRDQAQRRFVKTVTQIRSSYKGHQFITDLLTEAEVEMLAKRLAALFMLAQGFSRYRTHKILCLSPATTSRLHKELEQEKHPFISAVIQKKKEREIFWKEIESLVRLGMPEMGKNRWKWLDEMDK